MCVCLCGCEFACACACVLYACDKGAGTRAYRNRSDMLVLDLLEREDVTYKSRFYCKRR